MNAPAEAGFESSRMTNANSHRPPMVNLVRLRGTLREGAHAQFQSTVKSHEKIAPLCWDIQQGATKMGSSGWLRGGEPPASEARG